MDIPGLLKVVSGSRLVQLNILPWLPKVYIKIKFLSNLSAFDFIRNIRGRKIHFYLISEDHKTVWSIGNLLEK